MSLQNISFQNYWHQSAACALLVSTRFGTRLQGFVPIQPEERQWGPTLMVGDKAWLPVRALELDGVGALRWPVETIHTKLGNAIFFMAEALCTGTPSCQREKHKVRRTSINISLHWRLTDWIKTRQTSPGCKYMGAGVHAAERYRITSLTEHLQSHEPHYKALVLHAIILHHFRSHWFLWFCSPQ